MKYYKGLDELNKKIIEDAKFSFESNGFDIDKILDRYDEAKFRNELLDDLALGMEYQDYCDKFLKIIDEKDSEIFDDYFDQIIEKEILNIVEN